MEKLPSARLTATFVKSVTRPGRYGDGGHGANGLSLLVKPKSGGGLSKTWSQRLIMNSKVRTFGLGSADRVSLAEARQEAARNATKLKVATSGKSSFDRALEEAGLRPQVVRHIYGMRDEMPPELMDQYPTGYTGPTFEALALETLERHSEGWKPGSKTATLWRNQMETYAFPKIGPLEVDAITPSDILRVLDPIWLSKPETARKVKQRISTVMQTAIAHGYIKSDPTVAAMAGLPKKRRAVKHHSAIAWQDVPELLRYVRRSRTYPGKRLCIEFLTLTAARTTEARAATWGEIDMESRTWTIPASRMKAQRQHRVPLSSQAMAVLEQAKALRRGHGANDLIFPDDSGILINQDGLRSLLKRQGEITSHGMRSTFRDWCAEQTDCPREIVELALAHVEGTTSELAYRRTDYFAKRADLMQAWSDFCSPA